MKFIITFNFTTKSSMVDCIPLLSLLRFYFPVLYTLALQALLRSLHPSYYRSFCSSLPNWLFKKDQFGYSLLLHTFYMTQPSLFLSSHIRRHIGKKFDPLVLRVLLTMQTKNAVKKVYPATMKPGTGKQTNGRTDKRTDGQQRLFVQIIATFDYE